MRFRVLLILLAAHRVLSVLFAMLLVVRAVYFAAAHDAPLDFVRFVAIYHVAQLPAQDYSRYALNASRFVEYEAAMLAKRHHLPDVCGRAHYARTVIADWSHGHQIFAALAPLSHFGYVAAHD